jgi:hypothetical protein
MMSLDEWTGVSWSGTTTTLVETHVHFLECPETGTDLEIC